MPGIFIGENGYGLRVRYADLLYSAVAGNTTVSNSVLLATMQGAGRLVYFNNKLNCDIGVVFQSPAPGAPKLFAFELAAGDSLNFESLMPGQSFDAGTMIYIYQVGASAPTSGKVRVISWT